MNVPKVSPQKAQLASYNQVHLMAFMCGLAFKLGGTISIDRRRGEDKAPVLPCGYT